MRFLTWRQELGDPECPYLIRWAINFGPLGSIRLHHWLRSDDKRHMHDHPQDFVTLVLSGSYTDVSPCPVCKDPACEAKTYFDEMKPGMMVRRKAEHIHYVDVAPGGCWTLLYFWPKRRNWGFWVPRKDNGVFRFKKANKYFLEHGHHPCDQP